MAEAPHRGGVPVVAAIRGRFSAENFKLVLDAAGSILAGPIHFRGQDFASRREALVSALGDLNTWAQINLLNDEDKKRGRALSRSKVERRRGSAEADLRRVLRSLTDEDGKLLPQLRDAIVEAAKPADRPPLRPEDAADVELTARILSAFGGDIDATPEVARRLKAAEADSQRVDHAMAEMRWLAERLERAEGDALDAAPYSEPLLDDICVIWTEILGRRVGAAPDSFVRFAKACLVLLGNSKRPTRDAIRAAARRWHDLNNAAQAV